MTALTDELKAGLDAPICLTWELTYACNLACIHCLSSSGRRDAARAVSTAEAKAVIDEMRSLQVFYVNIGGRRADDPARLLRAGRLRHRQRGRGEVLDQRFEDRRRRGPAAGHHGLHRHPDLDRRGRRGHQRRRPGPRVVRHRPGGHGPPGRRRLRPVQDQRGHDQGEHRPARRLRGAGRPLRGRAAADPATPGWAGCRLVAPATPDPGPAGDALPVAPRPAPTS